MTRPACLPPLKRREHGLPAKLLAFFELNQDEELTFDDIKAKWGASDANVSMAVKRLVREGAIDDCPRVIRKRANNTGVW